MSHVDPKVAPPHTSTSSIENPRRCSKIYENQRTSIEHLRKSTNIYENAPPPETQFSLVNDTFKQAFGRSKGTCFFILQALPLETQRSLVNDTFKQTFGRS